MRRTRAEEQVNELFLPSRELGLVIGPAALTKPEAATKVWAYVKACGLQDPEGNRVIRADALLLPLFENPTVTIFHLPKILERHLQKYEA